MTKPRPFVSAVEKHAAEAPSEELPVLLDHLDAYVQGVKAVMALGAIKPGRAAEVDLLIREAHEARFSVQDELKRRGWKLEADAHTWRPS